MQIKNRRKKAYGISSLQIADLIIFVKTAELGSMSAAGRELGHSYCLMSKRIAIIEESMNVTLFNRNTRSLSLTKAGELLLPKAREVLNSVNALTDSIPSGEEPDLPLGRFVLGQFAGQKNGTEYSVCCCQEPAIWWRVVLKKEGPAFTREVPLDWRELDAVT